MTMYLDGFIAGPAVDWVFEYQELSVASKRLSGGPDWCWRQWPIFGAPVTV